jgi:hypothetical protein
LRHAALRRRLRPRGEPAQSRQLLQCRRFPAHARAHPGVARRKRVEHALGARTDGRDVADCALFGAMAGPDPRSPSRSASRAAPSSARCGETFGRSASPGAAISAGCRWIPG